MGNKRHSAIIGVLDSWGSVTGALARHGAATIDIDYKHELKRAIHSVDALVFTGGGDIAPSRYGMESHPRMYGVDPSRDELEFEAVRLARKYRIPMMGICRGHQLLNVAHGGTLIQHLGDLPKTHTHGGGSHAVKVRKQSKVGRVVGSLLNGMTTLHHQAVDRLGDGLVPVGWAPDGTVEMLESAHGMKPYILGVQFHPEMDYRLDPLADAIFAHFVEVAINKSIGRGDIYGRWENVSDMDSDKKYVRSLSYRPSTSIVTSSGTSYRYDPDLDIGHHIDVDGWRDWDEYDPMESSWRDENADELRAYFKQKEAESIGMELNCTAKNSRCRTPEDCAIWNDCAAHAVQKSDQFMRDAGYVHTPSGEWVPMNNAQYQEKKKRQAKPNRSKGGKRK